MRALVLCAGESCSDALLYREAALADLIVCADGAWDWVKDKAVRIDLFVGDMDSVKADIGILPEQIVTRLPVEKDMTDGEYAADLAADRGAGTVVMLGALGKRLDHALGNIQVLIGLRKRGIEGIVMDDATEVYAIDAALTVCGNEGDTLSIIPLGEQVVVGRTEGLYYPLVHSHLRLDETRGVSNVLTAKTARIALDSGWAAVLLVNK